MVPDLVPATHANVAILIRHGIGVCCRLVTLSLKFAHADLAKLEM